MKIILRLLFLSVVTASCLTFQNCNDAQPDDQLPTPWDIDTTKNDTTINKTDSLIGL